MAKIRTIVDLVKRTAKDEDEETTAPALPEDDCPPDIVEAEMTLMDHLIELRDRIMKAALGLAVGTVVGFIFARQAFDLLINPLPEEAQVIALSPTDSIFMYFKVALILGLIISMPVILYQVIMFIIPGLYPHERRYLYWLLPAGTIAFAAGTLFSAFIVIPFSIRYLSGFMADIISPTYQVQNYIGFVTTLMFWIGIVFEMPLIIYFLSKLGVVDYKKLASARRYAIVGIAVLAAVITPTPDPVTMLLVMGPLVLLYELGVQLARIA
ncbi:MAG: twin-arginine translocase subunit TatC [Anaerolineae bacterium]|nr:twin-arginine translocase subunit TatC [Anaerolineae bacterium]